MAENVALTAIEWPDGKGGAHRLAPGDPIPDELDADSAKELRANGSIGSRKELDAQRATADEEARLQSVRAQAAEAGYKLVKDGGSGSSKSG
jgi:hypothetical protein